MIKRREEGKASRRTKRASTLPDWIKEHNSKAKIYAVSGKDRAAITMGGKQANAAFWHGRKSGLFGSSSYYSDVARDWLDDFNDQKFLRSYFGKVWEALAVDEELLDGMGIKDLDQGHFPETFPHVFGEASFLPDKKFYNEITSSPFSDSYVLAFSKRLIVEEEIGTDVDTDYLAISFSTLDLVGHKYGPHSREVLDTVLRLERPC